MQFSRRLHLLAIIFIVIFSVDISRAQEASKITINWDKTVKVSKTNATLQVVVNPPLRRGTPVHDNAYAAVRDLQADFVRYVPWLPYPKLGVAELEPPKDGKTFWDFSLIDPMTIDFLEATKGHSVILNFSTIPQWMFKDDKPATYPDDPNLAVWTYEHGHELRDPSGKEVADYFPRILSWYTQGGFTDELGKRHDSGHHFSIPYWEVLNEPELEHQVDAEMYTRIYDEAVTAMHKVSPQTKFLGVSLAYPSNNPHFFEYFLDAKNHKPGVPLDYISYHFYAIPSNEETAENQQFSFFAQAEGFLNTVRFIEAIRLRLSPNTGTMVNEIGAISADDLVQGDPGHVTKPIPGSYWNLAGAMYAYIFSELTHIGIDVAGESQLVGYPTQFPSVSMVDWENGKPNPRFWVLKLLHDNFGPGDKLVDTQFVRGYVYASAVITRDGKKRVLLINKRDRPFEINVPGASGGQQSYVDGSTGFQPPASSKLTSEKVSLAGFSVKVVTLP